MRIPRLLFFAAAFYVLGGLSADAAVQTLETGRDCKSATTTAAMRACQNARFQKAEQELNAAYKDLMVQLDDGRREKLRVAQSAWLRFREANADFEADAARGGTLAPLIKMTVLADMTEARTAELKKSLRALSSSLQGGRNIQGHGQAQQASGCQSNT
jgi:uncharacterized protein YecT (DUF1311 family)